MVRVDGTPLIRRYVYNAYRRATYHALDGSEVPRPKENEKLARERYLAMPRRGMFTFPLDGPGARQHRRFNDGQTPPNFWYFLHDGARDGRGYFVGYDSQSKLCVGFIGRDGFRPDQPPVEQWFPMDGAKLASGTAFRPATGMAAMATTRGIPRGKYR